MRKVLTRILIVILLSVGGNAWGQRVWSVSGVVTDQKSGEALPFAQVAVVGSTVGTMTDLDGRFDLTVALEDSALMFRLIGYRDLVLPIDKKSHRKIRVHLEPTFITLEAVNITAERTSKRYRRKDNPAVDLVKAVIDHKSQNGMRDTMAFSRRCYEKQNFSLDQFHPDFETHRLWKHFPFVEKYIGQAEFDGAEVLHFGIMERDGRETWDGHKMRSLTTARRMDGVASNVDVMVFDDESEAAFAPVDIYSNDINLLGEQFVSPLSSVLAVGFYHYFITDTVEEEGERLIELSFVPATQGTYGFVGSMMIVDDSTYAVRRYTLRVPESAGMNFVKDLTVIHGYSRDSLGRNIPIGSDMYCRFYVAKRLRYVYFHHKWIWTDYRFGGDYEPMPDSLFGPLVTKAQLPNARKVRRKEWNEHRPIELTFAETFVDSLRYELMTVPLIKYTARTLRVLGTGYIPTSASRDSSRFDFGSVYNFVSHNGTEGLRLKLGGMSTVRLSNRNFAEGYLAYGLDDKRMKFGVELYHTFAEKRRYPTESPLGYLCLKAGYDLESPGLSFDALARDNIFMWTDQEVPAQYVADFQLKLRKRWPSNLDLDTWVGVQQISPTGMLDYYRVGVDGPERVDRINHALWSGRVAYTFGTAKGGRNGEGALVQLTKNNLWLSVGHEMGLLDGFYYNRTTANANGRLWLAGFGVMELQAKGGVVWNPVPMPKLFYPSGNVSPFLFSGTFNMMQPMEFVNDRFISLFATYHMKGLILNHVPLVRRLHWREVVSFSLLHGTLSQKNEPLSRTGLYMLPSTCGRMTDTPYMEFSIGIENILKLIRIDYVRRLSYLEGISMPYGVKVTMSVGF